MHKGRKIDDPNSSFGTAGVKPTAWFNNNGESVLLKTNFVYDPKIAEVLDKSGIDILTNQSAAKAFNREYVEISKNEFDGLENKDALNIARLAANKKGPRNVAEIGLENLFLGKSTNGVNGPSLKTYLDYIYNADVNKENLSPIISSNFQKAKESIDLLDSNLVNQINNDKTKMLNAFDKLQAIVVNMKTDMLSLLSIQVDYIDADGD